MRRAIGALCVTLWAATAYAADPQAAAMDYITALSQQDFAHAVKLIRASDLVEYKKTFDELFSAEAAAGKKDLLVAAFGPDAKLSDALNAKPDEVFIATMNVVMGAVKTANMKLAVEPAKYLGKVSEDAHLVHVLVRTYAKLGDSVTSRVEVVTTVAEGSDWKVVLPDQLKAIGQVMRRQMALRAAKP